MGSTRWEWKLCKVSGPPSGQQQQPPKASSSGVLPSRALREPTTLTVRYRGGPEAWWEVKARGKTYRLPGHLCLHDALSKVYGPSRRD